MAKPRKPRKRSDRARALSPFGQAFTEIRMAVDITIDDIALRSKLAPSTIKKMITHPRRCVREPRFASLLFGMALPLDGEDAIRLREAWEAMPSFDEERTPNQLRTDVSIADAVEHEFADESPASVSEIAAWLRDGGHRRAYAALPVEGHPYNWILDLDFPLRVPGLAEDWQAEREAEGLDSTIPERDFGE